MTFDADAPYPSLTALAAAYRDGSVTPSEVTRAHLARITRVDTKIGALQALYADDALLQAEAADRLMAAGASLGPFHGIPFVLKDLCDVAGRITTGGSKAMATRMSSVTGTVAARLLAAGGILLGKTKTVECALGGWGTNQHMGTPRNPWDMDAHRIPGGSSSGTGAGVASGLAVCGVGTDTGGSVRLPAGFCGLVGLKVTEGRLPNDGILALSHTLDTPGPLARSVKDAALMFMVMDGIAGSKIAQDLETDGGLFGDMARDIKGLHLGVLNDAERAMCTADVLAAYDASLEVLAGLGATFDVFEAQARYADLTAECGTLIATEGWFHRADLYARDDLPLDTAVRTRMMAGRDVSAARYMSMLAARQQQSVEFLRRMQGFDALLTPSMTTTAPCLSDVDEAVAPSHFTRHVNYFGLCAASVPSGLSEAGLPTSLQVIARPHAEAMALRIASAFEGARPALTYPAL